MDIILINVVMFSLLVLTILPLLKTFQYKNMLLTALDLVQNPDVRQNAYNHNFDEQTEEEYAIIKSVAIPVGIASIVSVISLWIQFVLKVEIPTMIEIISAIIIGWQVKKNITFNSRPVWLSKWLTSLLLADIQNDLKTISQDIKKYNDAQRNIKKTVDKGIISEQQSLITQTFLTYELERLTQAQIELLEVQDNLLVAKENLSKIEEE